MDQAFAVAKSFKPLTDAEMTALLSRTEAAARNGRYELFKTTAYFDTTAKHPDFLGGQTAPVLGLAPVGNG
jgi:hypothetical protein